MADDTVRRPPPLDTARPMPESAYRIDDARAAALGVPPLPSATGRAHSVGAGPIPRQDASAPRIDEAQRGGTETEVSDSRKTVPPSPASPEAFSGQGADSIFATAPREQCDHLRGLLREALAAYESGRDALLAERDRLETECRDLGDKLDAANVRYAQLSARCEAAERDRNEAREAARQASVGNAALWRRYDALRAALDYAENEIASVLAVARLRVENAQAVLRQPETASDPLAPL